MCVCLLYTHESCEDSSNFYRPGAGFASLISHSRWRRLQNADWVGEIKQAWFVSVTVQLFSAPPRMGRSVQSRISKFRIIFFFVISALLNKILKQTSLVVSPVIHFSEPKMLSSRTQVQVLTYFISNVDFSIGRYLSFSGQHRYSYLYSYLSIHLIQIHT